jgi:hypothetical protein
LQLIGLRQIPTAAPWALSQVTLPSPGKPVPGAPQQSLVSLHTSPSTWQPLAGWQMDTPVGPYGAQSRLQQSLQAPQTVPSIPSLQNVGPLGAAPHVPTVLPDAIVHVPEQQSLSLAHKSPLCTQNEAPS